MPGTCSPGTENTKAPKPSLATGRQSQPHGLYVLFFTEMWERFGYYGLRAALVLYLTQKLRMTEEDSYALFGAFGSFLYLSPLGGGLLADKYLGRKWSVLLGGLLLIAGYCLLAFSGNTALYAGLASVVAGNGLFKPNISGMLRFLYGEGDIRREGGFTFFYGGVNLGAMLAALVAGFVIKQWGWSALFLTSAAGCLFGMLVFIAFQPWKQTLKHDTARTSPSLRCLLASSLGVLGCVALCSVLLHTPSVADMLILAVGGLFVAHTLKQAFLLDPRTRNTIVGCLLLIFFVSLLWAIGQQAGMSLSLFAAVNVDRLFMGHLFSPESFQAVDPLVIIACGPLLAGLWTMLRAHGRNPGLLHKFLLGALFMALSCFFIPLGIARAGADGLSAPGWLVCSYLFQGLAEIVVAPAGLNMIAEHIPKQMTSTMYGLWLYAIALGNLMASALSECTTVPGHETVANTNPLFADLFNTLGIGLLLLAGLFLLSRGRLRRMLGE